tara:strand:+ start:668 stop:1174 length:507 start_codon:yes stop_codon:yes gene_type:complete
MAGFHTKTFIKHDDYMTPKHAWENIAHLIPKDKIMWEAFYGDGSSGTHLRDLGFNTIHEPIDFFDDDTVPEYDILISNPPFSQSKNIMNRLYELDKPFILIMPAAKINTSYFRRWRDRNIQIVIPRKRIHFTKLVDGIVPDNYKSSCNFDCFYYCYKIGLDKDITWLE